MTNTPETHPADAGRQVDEMAELGELGKRIVQAAEAVTAMAEAGNPDAMEDAAERLLDMGSRFISAHRKWVVHRPPLRGHDSASH
jgi:hypothetical protein